MSNLDGVIIIYTDEPQLINSGFINSGMLKPLLSLALKLHEP